MSETRRDVLASNLLAVRTRIAAAARAAGREPEEVTLVAVTKTRPAEDIAHLAALGVTDVGESRDQEAAKKRRLAPAGLRWHMVGRMQSNKARSVAEWADVVHSVDRLGLVEPLAAGAERAARGVGVCVQVSLDGDPDRGGALPPDVPELAAAVADAPGLELLGLMAVVPLRADPDKSFRRLAELREAFLTQHPTATMLSAGMSGDLEQAVRWGATHVRIGTALLGTALLPKPPPAVR